MDKSSVANFLKGKGKVFANVMSKAKTHGFFHILGGNTLVKVISILSVLLFPRIMGADFGVFKNADNYYNYILILNGLGMANVILRYCAVFTEPKDQKSYFAFAVRLGVAANIFLVTIFLGIIYISKALGVSVISYGSENFLALMLGLAFFDFLFTSSQNLLRTCMKNKEYAKNSVIFSVMFALVPLLFAYVFKFAKLTVLGAIIGRYVAYAITIYFVIKCVTSLPTFKVKAYKLNRDEKWSAIKYALNALIASGFSLIMPINENAIITKMVPYASYQDFVAAQIVPSALQFISTSIVVFVFPYFAKNYKDGKWILHKTNKTVLSMCGIMTAIAVIGIIFAPWIILVFGEKFKTPDSIRLMRIMFITFAINGAIRMPIGNILAAIGEVKFNLYNAIFSCTVHIAICWAMTATYGIKGAAYGLLIGYIISSVAAILYLIYYCRKLERQKLREQSNPS